MAKMIDKLGTILGYYGEYNQLSMLQEECAELIQAVNKYRRNPSAKSVDRLLEEFADVYVVMTQVSMMSFYDRDRVTEIIDTKVNRELKRIEQAKGER